MGSPALILFALLPAIAAAAMVGSQPNVCFNITGDASALPEIRFPSTYKVSAVYTDWGTNVTAKVNEAKYGSSIGMQLIKREANTQKWTSIGENKVFFNSSVCKLWKSGDSAPFSFPGNFSSFNLKTSSIYDLITDFLSKKMTGMNNGVSVVSGVEGVIWVSCNNDTGLSVQAVYAGDKSIPPLPANISNPQLLSLSFIHYSKILEINSTVEAHVSLQLEPFEDVDLTDSLFLTPAGLSCDGLPAVDLPVTFPKSFTATVSYGTPTGLPSVSTVTYDSARNMTGESPVSGGSARVFNESGLPADARYVLHDFPRSSEYVLSGSGCRLSALANSRDVQGGVVASPSAIFLPTTTAKYSFYHNTSGEGRSLSVYRTPLSADETLEAHVDSAGALVALFNYNKGAPTSWTRFSFSPSVDTLTLLSTVHDCFNVSSNGTFSVLVPGKSMWSVKAIGSGVVAASFSDAFSAAGSAVSPRRFSFFYSEETLPSPALRVIFTLAEKPQVIGSAAENTTAEFISAFNATLMAKDFIVTLPSADGKTETWTVSKGSLSAYPPSSTPPPPSPPSFTGYSGGSMFVLAVFMLLFGVGIGAGGLFFVTRRQRISTLAYQVFE